MKKFGLIGGVGPESTMEYYRQIIKRFRELTGSIAYPDFLIKSIDMNAMLNLVRKQEYEGLTRFLSEHIAVLEKVGVDYAAIASNTPHIVFDRLADKSRLPLISIVDAACMEAQKRKLKNVVLFGTRSTMTHGFYQKTAECFGITIRTPNSEQIDYIHNKYMSELIYKELKAETKKGLLSIVNKMKEQHPIEGLILGGTELPLILNQDDFADIKVLDTTQIHVEAIVQAMIGE